MAATLCTSTIFSKTLLWHPTGARNSCTKFEVSSSINSTSVEGFQTDRQTERQTDQCSKPLFRNQHPPKRVTSKFYSEAQKLQETRAQYLKSVALFVFQKYP